MRSLQKNRFLCTVLFLAATASFAQQRAPEKGNAVLWTDPGDIRSRNLYWGPGGEKHQPVQPVKFLAEDLHGTNPKFDVRDSDDKKWHLKMGVEARPEVAASRLLWAIGYSANENYFFQRIHVDGLPPHLKRGQGYIQSGGDVPNVRLQKTPKGEKKTGHWNWKHNPFAGTREFNGLRVMMALIRNWDLKDDNNAILQDDAGHMTYEVTDVGTSFGSAGKRHSSQYSKSNLKEYGKGRLISRADSDYVDLHFPHAPSFFLMLFEPRFYFWQTSLGWVGRQIPRADAKWVASLLAQLSPDQIRDAFRAAGYSPEQIEGYTNVMLSRIKELQQL